MPRQSPQAICDALLEVKKFFLNFGDSNFTRIAPLERMIGRFQQERLSKEMLMELTQFKDETYLQTREQIWGGRRLPGPYETKEKTEAEFYRIFALLGGALNPSEPESPRMNVSTFVGSEFVKEKEASYEGAPDRVRPIVEGSINVVRRHCEALSREDYAAAYNDTGIDLRAWMNPKKFETAHKDASREYGGPPMEFHIEAIEFVLADENARKRSTQAQGWPKTTPRETRRAKLNGFWIRDSHRHGCWGSFWITEEGGVYRIARFNFWTM